MIKETYAVRRRNPCSPWSSSSPARHMFDKTPSRSSDLETGIYLCLGTCIFEIPLSSSSSLLFRLLVSVVGSWIGLVLDVIGSVDISLKPVREQWHWNCNWATGANSGRWLIWEITATAPGLCKEEAGNLSDYQKGTIAVAGDLCTIKFSISSGQYP